MMAPMSKLTRALLVGLVGLAATVLVRGSQVGAAEAPVGLGTAGSFAVLAGSTVTNTGPTVISGELGVSPGTAVVGFPPGIVNNGTIHAGDAVAAQAQLDLTTAYDDAAGRAVTANVAADLSGQTFVSGVYRSPTLGLGVNGTVTLDAQGDPNAVFIFQAGSTLITGSASVVSLVNGADPCNVFWQVGSSATLGTNSVFVGTVMALASVTAETGATVAGRLLARNGAVTLDDNRITTSNCAVVATTTTTAAVSTTTSTTTTSSTTPATSTTLPATTVTTLGTGTSGTTAVTAGTSSATGTGTAATGTGTGTAAAGTGTAGPGATSAAAATASGASRGTTTAAPPGTSSTGSGSGDSSTATSGTTPLARTGWPLMGTAVAGFSALFTGYAMLLASRPERSTPYARRYRC